jgi:dTDP-L-rhamnose 4-epimerase
MKVLITGGAGFIGSHLADRLLQEGYEVRLLDNLQARVHRGRRPAYLSSDAELVVGDVRDTRIVERALAGVEAVFHLAAYQDYLPDFSTYFAVNTAGTALLYETLVRRRTQVRRMVVASSQAVYGEGQYRCAEHGEVLPPARSEERLRRGLWEVVCPTCGGALERLDLREDRVNPYNSYALSKYAAEMTALRLGEKYGIPTVALRFSIVQGPRQSPKNCYSGVTRIFAQRLLRGEPPVLFEDGEQLRDYTHVSDVVEACLKALADERAIGGVFNVGSGLAVTVRRVAERIAAALGRDIRPVVTGEYRVGDNRHSVSSIERLRALGWSPGHSLDETLADAVQWLLENPPGEDALSEADRVMRSLGVVCRVEAAAGTGPARLAASR